MRKVALTSLAMVALVAGCLDVPSVGDSGTACTVPRLAQTPENDLPPMRPGFTPTPVLSDAEAVAAGDCVRPHLRAAFARSEAAAARDYAGWRRYSRQFYGSEHGRYLEVYANDKATAYGRWEESGVLPQGAVIAKQSFSVTGAGVIGRGPLFLLEKMAPGFSAATNDWKFTLVGQDGAIVGETAGRNAAGIAYCAECHQVARHQDFLIYVPAAHRIR